MHKLDEGMRSHYLTVQFFMRLEIGGNSFDIVVGLVVQAGTALLEAKIDGQASRLQTKHTVGFGHAATGRHLDRLYGLMKPFCATIS